MPSQSGVKMLPKGGARADMLSDIADFLLFGANALAFGLLCSAVLYFCYHRARSNGYSPPVSASIILTGIAGGMVLTSLLKHSNTTRVFEFWLEYFWTPLVLSAVATAILLAILPRRKMRTFGRRRVRFPLVGIGRALIIIGIVITGLAVVLWRLGKVDADVVSNALILALVFLLGTGRYLIRRARQALAAPAIEELLASDSRQPVLYLRAFAQESQFFVIGPASEYRAYSQSWHARMSKPDQNIGVSFEEFLGGTLSHSIGPFIGLGSPEDYLPPGGATRTYADDTHWKDLFSRYACQSACIVAEIVKSTNLRWELSEIRREGLQEKLYLFEHCAEGSYKFQWAVWKMLWLLRGVRRVRWSQSARELADLGYEIAFEDPGPGSIITFDRQGRATVLTTSAEKPEEFVNPIRDWLTFREKTGRHVPVSCPRCGTPFYVFRAASDRCWCDACNLALLPGAAYRRVLVWVIACIYWTELLLSPFLIVPVLSILVSAADWHYRAVGITVLALLLFAIVTHIFVIKRAWDGSPKDDPKAAAWYRFAAGEGSPLAMVNLGLMHRKGWGGLPKDDVAAEFWYRKAADAGSPAGMNNLGFLYEYGLGGLNKSETDALAWYWKAASLGQSQAKESLRRLGQTAR